MPSPETIGRDTQEKKEVKALKGIYHLDVGDALATVYSGLEAWNLQPETTDSLETVFDRLLEYDPSGNLTHKLKDSIRGESENVVLKSLGINAKSYVAAYMLLDNPEEAAKIVEHFDPQAEDRFDRLKALKAIIAAEIARKEGVIAPHRTMDKNVNEQIQQLITKATHNIYSAFKYGLSIEIVDGEPQVKWKQVAFPLFVVCGNPQLPEDIQNFGYLTGISGVTLIPNPETTRLLGVSEEIDPSDEEVQKALYSIVFARGVMGIRDKAGQYKGTLGIKPAGHMDVEYDEQGNVLPPSLEVINRALNREGSEELGVEPGTFQVDTDSVVFSDDLVKPHNEVTYNLIFKGSNKPDADAVEEFVQVMIEGFGKQREQQKTQGIQSPNVGEGRLLILRYSINNLLGLFKDAGVYGPPTHIIAVAGSVVQNFERMLIQRYPNMPLEGVNRRTQAFADWFCSQIREGYAKTNEKCTNGRYNPNKVLPSDQGLLEPIEAISSNNPEIIERIIDPDDQTLYKHLTPPSLN